MRPVAQPPPSPNAGPDRRSYDEYRASLAKVGQEVAWHFEPSRAIWAFEDDSERPPDASDWFFVVGHPRTGSSVAAELLSHHRSIYCGFEHQVLPLLMAIFGAKAFVAPRLWYAVRYHKGIQITPANMRRFLDAWRHCLSNRPRFGDKGEMYYENFGDACAKVFPNCRFILTTRHPLDTLSSYAKQGWAAWLRHDKDPNGFFRGLRRRALLMLCANRRWSGRAEVLSFAECSDRGSFEAAYRRLFHHLRVDPEAFDYDAAWSRCQHLSAMGRWRDDQQIAQFLQWLLHEDSMLHELLLNGVHFWPADAPLPFEEADSPLRASGAESALP